MPSVLCEPGIMWTGASSLGVSIIIWWGAGQIFSYCSSLLREVLVWQSCIHWILIQPLWWLKIFHLSVGWLIWSSLPSMKASGWSLISNTLMGSHHFQETLINFLMTSWLIRRIQPRLYFWSSSTSDHSVGSPHTWGPTPPLARQVHAGTGGSKG